MAAAPWILFRLSSYNAVKQYLRELPEDVFVEAKQAFSDTINEAYSEMDQRLSGKALKQRSGSLRKTLTKKVSGDSLKTLKGSLSISGNAKVHEYGQRIQARNKYLWLRGGPYMNFPTAVNYGANGKPLRDARNLFSSGAVVKSGGQGMGLYLGGVKMMHLARTVNIPARLKFRDTTNKYIPVLIGRLEKLLSSPKHQD
jgi:hypothetical protein